MDELEQSDSEKETNDPHNTFSQNAKPYKEREKAFIKNYKCGIFHLVFVIKLGRHMNENYKRQTRA